MSLAVRPLITRERVFIFAVVSRWGLGWVGIDPLCCDVASLGLSGQARASLSVSRTRWIGFDLVWVMVDVV